MIFVVGIGPGGRKYMTSEALEAIEKSDVIVGYKTYLRFIYDLIEGKEIYESGMKEEVNRCKNAIDLSKKGKIVAVVSGGDSGIYGMAGLIHELNSREKTRQDIVVVQGVTSSVSAAADLGAPIMHDMCQISLSDLMTPWEVIEKRLKLAAEADFVICLYNPKSRGRTDHLKKAFEIMSEFKDGSTIVGIVKNAGRGEELEKYIMTFDEMDFDICDMSTMVIIGNKETYIYDDKMVTPRGYSI